MPYVIMLGACLMDEVRVAEHNEACARQRGDFAAAARIRARLLITLRKSPKRKKN